MSLTTRMYDLIVTAAQVRFALNGGKHQPLLMAYVPNYPMPVFVPVTHLLHSSISDEVAFATIRLLLRTLNANAYVMINEAWTAHSDPPSADPKRIEVLQILGVFPDGCSQTTLVPISDGKVVGTPSVLHSGDFEVLGGFHSLLKQADVSPEIERRARVLAAQMRYGVN